MKNDFKAIYARLVEDWFSISDTPVLLYKSFSPTPIFCNANNVKKVIQEEAKEISTRLYPNPATDFVVIESPAFESEVNNIALYDLGGREYPVEVEVISTYQLQIDLMNVLSGKYILNVQTNEGSVTKQLTVFK